MRPRAALLAVVLLLAACDAAAPTPSSTGTPAPHGTPAVPALVAALADHRVLAINDVHNDGYLFAVVEALLADPAFTSRLSVVGVGWGNAAWQAGVDRYVAGDDAAARDVDRALASSLDGPGVWEQPIYRGLFDTVRALNAALPDGPRIRIVLGEPAVPTGVVTQQGPCDATAPSCVDHWLATRGTGFAAAVLDAMGDDGRALVLAPSFEVRSSPGQAEPAVTDLLGRALGAEEVWRVLALDRMQRPALGLGPTLHGGSEVYVLAGTTRGTESEEVLFGHVTVSCDTPPCATAELPRALDEVVDALLDVAR